NIRGRGRPPAQVLHLAVFVEVLDSSDMARVVVCDGRLETGIIEHSHASPPHVPNAAALSRMAPSVSSSPTSTARAETHPQPALRPMVFFGLQYDREGLGA